MLPIVKIQNGGCIQDDAVSVFIFHSIISKMKYGQGSFVDRYELQNLMGKDFYVFFCFGE
jgi:hypothetical protein